MLYLVETELFLCRHCSCCDVVHVSNCLKLFILLMRFKVPFFCSEQID